MDLVMKGVDGLEKKKLEYLSLVSKVCRELESNLGLEDKVLAESIIEMGRNFEGLEDFAAQLKQLGARMPSYFLPMLLTVIHAIFPPNPKSKSSFPRLGISDARKRFEELVREIEIETKDDNEERGDRDRKNDDDDDYDGDDRRERRRRRNDWHGSDEPERCKVYKGRVSRVFETCCFVQLTEFRARRGMVYLEAIATGERIIRRDARYLVKRNQEVLVRVMGSAGMRLGLYLSMRDVDQNTGEFLLPPEK